VGHKSKSSAWHISRTD